MIKLFISVLFYCLYNCGCVILHFLSKKHFGTLAVLYYHGITSEQRSNFARQMDELIRVSKPVFADTKGPLSNGKHYSAVTFDDGSQNVLENGLPELRQRKMPVTLFIETGYLGQYPGWIYDRSHKDCKELAITCEQLVSLPSDFVMTGSHCFTHRDLTVLAETEIKKELVESKRKLEELLHREIELLAFPYGAYNKKVLELSKQAGYKRCFSVVPTFPSYKIDKFLIGRINVSPDDWLIEFRLKILGAYQWLYFWVSLKRKLYNLVQSILSIRNQNFLE